MPALDIKTARGPVERFVSRFPHCERVTVQAAGQLIQAGPEADLMHELRVRFLRRSRV